MVTAVEPNVLEDYKLVCGKLKEISALSGISGLLEWDEMVMMPEGAAESRSAQKAALAGVLHEKKVDQELGDALKRLQAMNGQLDAIQAAVVRDALRNYTRTAALTKELAQREANLNSKGYQAWVEARKSSDFSKFAPLLQQWIDHTRECCARIDPNKSAYDVCLDQYEKGMTSDRIDELFTQVKGSLIPLLDRLRKSESGPDSSWMEGEFDVDRQAKLCNELTVGLGFSLQKGRLDVSVHPFTGGAHPTDVRMTTRFKVNDLTEGITGAIHETGHALYEQGRNLEFDGLPVNESMSMGIHESQSLLWERMVGLGLPFQKYLWPKLRDYFPQLPDNKGPEDLYSAVNVVKSPSYIRVEADEVSYPMHIILRYELEKGLLEGSIAVEDVPQVWNNKMQQYLGVTPPTDAQGCLQDVHWSMGAIGYFPTYSLGAMYACQIFQAAKKDLPELESDIASGKFEGLRCWLNEKIHKSGSLYASGDQLMKAVTGAPLDPSIFVEYLQSKYAKLYSL